MNPLNPIFALIIFTIAFITAYLINLKHKFIPSNTRNQNIDGLRGFLALFVFIHHSSVWYQFLQIDLWRPPKSDFFIQLGQSSVSFFFMITAFLFISKLLNTNQNVFNWNTFFISRLFRLVPMYFVSVIILVLIIFIMSDFEMKEGFIPFFNSLFHWGIFTIISSPPINESIYTTIINAGVVWSLPFEWLFYFSLPIISLVILKNKPSQYYIIISFIFIISFYVLHGFTVEYALSFLGGAIAPFVIKYGNLKINFNSYIFGFFNLICLILIAQFESSSNLICKSLIILVFSSIALGNDVFGVLKSSTIKFLGEMCYSTYLLHGIILFIVMYFGIGAEKAMKLSPQNYCLVIFAVTPLVVIFSFLGFKYIESPFMKMAKKQIK